MKYDIKQVSRELLEQYAEHQLGFDHSIGDRIEVGNQLSKLVVNAAKVQLRTKAQVDADIAKTVRDYVKNNEILPDLPCRNLSFNGGLGEGHFPRIIEKLLKEETSD